MARGPSELLRARGPRSVGLSPDRRTRATRQAADWTTGPVLEPASGSLFLSSPHPLSLSSSAPAPLAPAPRASLRSQLASRSLLRSLFSRVRALLPRPPPSPSSPLWGSSPFFSSSISRDSAAFLSRVSFLDFGLSPAQGSREEEDGRPSSRAFRQPQGAHCDCLVFQLGCGISSITLRALGSSNCFCPYLSSTANVW